MSVADLTKPLAAALNEEIERLYAQGKIPRNRADANRHMIRAVQRFMEGQRAHIRHVAEMMIQAADGRYMKSLDPARDRKAEAIAGYRRAFEIFTASAEREFREASEPFRVAHDREVESIRDDVSARMSEADRIVKMSIRSIKKADFEELKRNFGKAREEERERRT